MTSPRKAQLRSCYNFSLTSRCIQGMQKNAFCLIRKISSLSIFCIPLPLVATPCPCFLLLNSIHRASKPTKRKNPKIESKTGPKVMSPCLSAALAACFMGPTSEREKWQYALASPSNSVPFLHSFSRPAKSFGSGKQQITRSWF